MPTSLGWSGKNMKARHGIVHATANYDAIKYANGRCLSTVKVNEASFRKTVGNRQRKELKIEDFGLKI
jgi:hypothetical protein